MADITRLVEAGKAFGYEGEELRAFVKDEQNRLRDERAQEREFIREEEERREVRRREEELEKRKFLLEQEEREEVRRREEELEKRKFLLEQEEREEVRRREDELEKRKFLVEQEREAREHELRKMELAKKCGVSLGQTNPRGPKIPPFDEAHDEIDSYIRRFEIYATAQGWVKSQWAMYLSALLKGRALDVYALMPVKQSSDFEYLKNALLQRYDLSEESFKRKFWSSKPETGESFAQFNTRLRSYFSRWIELAGLEKDYESLVDFMVRDQFLFICNTDLRTFLAEKRCLTSDEMAQMADWYRNARYTSAVSLTKQNKRQEQGKVEATGNSQSSRPQGPPQANGEVKRCFKCNSLGHLARDCPSAVKCYVCDRKGHVARECPKRQKVASILSQEDDDGMEDQQQGISNCGACTTDDVGESRKSTGSSMPVLEGKVSGKVVSVLRDTGCSGVIVRKSLGPVEALEGETQEIRLADRSVVSVPVAKVEIQTPYYTGKVRAWCFKNPLYDVMVGNIPGALGPDRPAEAVEGETRRDGQTKIHNPLLLMLRPSKVDQAQAFLKFFQANFWFNIILFVQDTFVVDGFYDQIKRNVSDPKWNFNTEIISERTTRKSLKVILNFLLTKQPRIVVVHASHTIARRLFSVAKSENLTEINHAWFITETSYTRDHDDLLLYPPGILTIIPNYVDDINDVITDGTNIMLKSVIKLSHSKSLPRSCQSNLTQDYVKAGKKMFGHLSSSTLTGISGDIVFDEIGRLRSSNYVVQNLVTEGAQRFWRQIGHIRGDDISPFGIIWPGESITSRISYGKKKYRVVTNPVKPFVMDGEPHKDYDHCAKDVTCVYINNTGKMETIQALRDYENGVFNESNPYYIRCCRGLSVDLLSRLASDLDFDYNLYIVSDTTYGKEIDGQWNGMVRDLMTGTAHFAVAAFSITRPRVKVIDFTVPYFFSGFSVLYTETQRATNMHAFLEPFDVPVWFAIIISATLTAIAMGIFEWNSPFGLNPWGKKRKQNYTLASGMTMVYSVLFGHIVKTKSPKAWPSKVMQNFWAFSCIFIIASYTANLAAFIAGKHAGVVYSSIHDSRLLDINVGVLPGSAVEGFVKKLNPRLYTKCQRRLVDTTDNAIHQLIHEKLDAYLGDYPILDYARAKLDPECKLRLLVQTFGEDGYGIGLPKGSPLKAPLSEKIQDYHDSGYIEDLIDVHFADSQCYKQRIKTEDSRLSYKHHAGSFVMLCVGIIVGIGILFLEHAIFKWVVPKFRDMPGNSIWKSVHLMFFSQRLHRTITSAELVPANETCKEMLGIMRNRDFMKLFQKSTIKTNKMADAAKRKRLNRNFFDVVEKAKWMKEMEDNNLFGSDPSPASPSPKITEISLRDITQAVDLTEFRKQNRENIGDLSNLFSSLKESNVDDNTWPPPPPDANKASSEAALPLCSPEVEKNEFSLIDVSSGENLVSAGSTPTLDIPSIQIANQPSINIAADLKDDFNYASNSLDKNNHGSNGHSPPGLLSDSLRPSRSKSDLDFIVNIDSGTPNGDLVSKSATDSKHHLHPRFQEVISESGDNPTCPLVRHLSMQKSKSKDSRTHHPRKRQSVYGNNKTSTKKNMNVEKFTKEELLLMWKSSELDLNQKLAAAKKDKERLESKLAGLQLQRSTHV